MSASRTPTARPSEESAAARLTVSVDFPTPPLPDATAMTRVLGSSWIALSSRGRPPRSFVVSALRSSGVITSKARRTEATPGSEPTSRSTCSSNAERRGQPATVSAIRTVTSPPSIAMPRTMSSSVTGLRSSGSITFASAPRMSSRVGIGGERSALVQPQALLQPDGVPGGEAFPVVVEVGEDVAVLAPPADPLRPLVELAAGIVAADPARAVVKADEREVRRQLVRLERRDLGPVRDHECDVVLTEQGGHLGREPARVTELHRVSKLRREARERGREAVVVAAERRRQLPQQRPELRRPKQRIDPVEEKRQVLVDVDETLDVRDVPAHLHGEEERRRRLGHPTGDGGRARQAVERRVQLDRVEEPCVVTEPARGRTALGVEDAVAPVCVVPARAAYADGVSAFAIRR